MENIGQKIKYLREIKGFSQAQLAKLIGVHQTAIGLWENGTNEPKASYIKALADCLEASADYLLGREEETMNIDIAARDGKRQTIQTTEKEVVKALADLEKKQDAMNADIEKLKKRLNNS